MSSHAIYFQRGRHSLTHLPLVPHICALTYFILDTWEQISVKFESKYQISFQQNAFECVICEMDPFCLRGNELNVFTRNLHSEILPNRSYHLLQVCIDMIMGKQYIPFLILIRQMHIRVSTIRTWHGVTARFVTRFNLWLRHDLWPHNASICDPARFVTKSASICDQRYTMIL